MPKSKRAKVTTLSKTPVRSTKASKTALVDKLRSELDRFDHVWLFSVGDMRNEGLKQVRAQWKDTGRLFFSKGKIMAKALGDSPELEYQEGLSGIASVSEHRRVNRAGPEDFEQLLRGPVGLFLTSHPVDDTVEWFDTWSKPEYARLGAIASRDVTLPAGLLLLGVSLFCESGTRQGLIYRCF